MATGSEKESYVVDLPSYENWEAWVEDWVEVQAQAQVEQYEKQEAQNKVEAKSKAPLKKNYPSPYIEPNVEYIETSEKENRELVALTPNANKVLTFEQQKKKIADIEEIIFQLQEIEDRKIESPVAGTQWFDLNTIYYLGRAGAPVEEIAACCLSTPAIVKRELEDLDSPVSIVYNRSKVELHLKLRNAQINNAILENDASMQKWLGKQLLKQKDTIEMDTSKLDEFLQDDEKRRARLSQLDRMLKMSSSQYLDGDL
jgi:hypothetical protein